jgi:Choline/Carnitine o-acyltransferase
MHTTSASYASRRMFNMTRIPHERIDRLHKASTSNPAARRIILLIRNHIFTVDVYDENGVFIGLSAMTERLQSCAVAALSSKPAIPIPILTADGRDAWAKVRMSLKRILEMLNQFKESRAPSQLVGHQPHEPFGDRLVPFLSITGCNHKRCPASLDSHDP